MAQSQPAGEAQSLDEVVVTAATRLNTGFDTPTPVIVIDREAMQERGASNIADYLNELPAFFGSVTPQTTTTDGYANGQNLVDLRGLGSQRTLVLIDRRRYVPVNTIGSVDLNVVPQSLVDRVEVVTGGASAKWGSNAVAGVVNLHTDRTLEGVRFESRFGQSSVGDDRDKLFSFAAGTSAADGRAHISFGGEYESNDGITTQSSRSWGRERWGIVANPADTGPNDGIPARIIVPNVVLGIAADGGYLPAWAGNAPAVSNLRFGPGGKLLPYNIGTVPAPANSLVLPFQIGGDGASFGDATSLSAPFERKNLMTLTDYKLTETINLFLDASFGQSRSVNPLLETVNTIFLGGPTDIHADNPYIPAALQQIMSGNGISDLYLARSNGDFGLQTSDSKTTTVDAVFGLQGKIARWSWEAYASYGNTDALSVQWNRISQTNYDFATDAVRDPATGQVVCRANLGGANGAPGCEPLNLFGVGAPSAAALAYIKIPEVRRVSVDETVVAASASGTVPGLPAGDLAIAFGGEYRKDGADTHPDPYYNPGSQDFSGDINAKEAFVEAGAPLLATDNGLALDLNAAVRYTNYNTSGGVTSWEGGLTFKPYKDLSVRGAESRDIRAPNILELYSLQTEFFGTVQDPFAGGTSVVRFHVGGNPDLRPETADTTTLGVVYRPSWLDGFGMSVDFYSIRIKSAITSLQPQNIVDNCYNLHVGCDALGFDPSTGAIDTINAQNINVARRTVKGIDYEIAQRLNNVMGGKWDFRLLASYVREQSYSPDGLTTYDDAGVVSTDAQGGVPTPKWRWNLTSDYTRGNYGLFAQIRYVDGGKYEANLTNEDISTNVVDHIYYVNLGAHYDVAIGADRTIQAYAGVNNVFDRAPPIDPIDFLMNVRTNPSLYDVVGRYWFVGMRLRL